MQGFSIPAASSKLAATVPFSDNYEPAIVTSEAGVKTFDFRQKQADN
jgi:hypothetical protein